MTSIATTMRASCRQVVVGRTDSNLSIRGRISGMGVGILSVVVWSLQLYSQSPTFFPPLPDFWRRYCPSHSIFPHGCPARTKDSITQNSRISHDTATATHYGEVCLLSMPF